MPPRAPMQIYMTKAGRAGRSQVRPLSCSFGRKGGGGGGVVSLGHWWAVGSFRSGTVRRPPESCPRTDRNDST